MVGAGSALGAPSDAANIFKSVLARGEVRMVARDDAERVQGIHPGRRGAGAPLPLRHGLRADDRRDAPHPLQPAAAPRAELLGAPARRGDRDRARAVAALHAAPASARQGDRLARHRRGARGDRSPLGSEEGRHRLGDLARGADSGRHGVPRRHRSVQGHRGAAAEAGRRPAQRDRRGGAAPGAEQGAAQGRLRSARRRAAVPRADRRRQDRAGEVGRRVPVRRRQEDDSRRHVGVPGRRRVGRQADRHAARHRRQRARRRADQSAEGQSVLRRPARRGREGEPEHAEPVPAGVRRRLDDRRPRQARLSERRRHHHDVEHRRGELPQADEPARVPARARSASSRCRAKYARARTPVPAGVPQPHRRSRAVRAADARRGARDREALPRSR